MYAYTYANTASTVRSIFLYTCTHIYVLIHMNTLVHTCTQMFIRWNFWRLSYFELSRRDHGDRSTHSHTHCVALWCSVMQCVILCCSALQCIAVCYSVLQCVTVCCSVLWYVKQSRNHVDRHAYSHTHANFFHRWHLPQSPSRIVCCNVFSVLQCVAVCCSVLQCAAVCCSVMQCGDDPGGSIYVRTPLQPTATHCNPLQHTVTHCNTL